MHTLLHYLESLPEDRYVLHGSPHRPSVIQPRQTLMDASIPEYQEYAVYGTLYPPAALLYATIPIRRDWWGWYLDDDATLVVKAVAQTKIVPQDGYIHVLPRAPFTKVVPPGLVCLAHQPVTPLEVLEVPAGIFRHLQETGAIRIDE